MWIDKLTVGVLRVLTPVGPRYIKPEFPQRLYLLWMFRHFHMLPQQVLSRRQQRLVNWLCTQHRFVTSTYAIGVEDMPILGTVDWQIRDEIHNLERSQPNGGLRATVARFAASVHTLVSNQ